MGKKCQRAGRSAPEHSTSCHNYVHGHLESRKHTEAEPGSRAACQLWAGTGLQARKLQVRTAPFCLSAPNNKCGVNKLGPCSMACVRVGGST